MGQVGQLCQAENLRGCIWGWVKSPPHRPGLLRRVASLGTTPLCSQWPSRCQSSRSFKRDCVSLAEIPLLSVNGKGVLFFSCVSPGLCLKVSRHCWWRTGERIVCRLSGGERALLAMTYYFRSLLRCILVETFGTQDISARKYFLPRALESLVSEPLTIQ